MADQVERIRGLRFRTAVRPEPVTQGQIATLLQDALAEEFPAELEARRGRAWETIGAIPPGTDLRRAYVDYAGSEVIGFYDTISHRLVFVGTASPTPFQRMTLAHELTHALDDQAFGLGLLDRLLNACQDERLAAFLGLSEGDAVNVQLRWAQEDLSFAEQQSLQREASSFAPPPPSIPPFVQMLLGFPYVDGPAFVHALIARGGEAAVNRAFRDPPLSTEQIIHPDRYPGDVPRTVRVPELAEKLGGPWKDLDVQDVGEEWLRALLGLRLSTTGASRAAAGWDGGQYRAWRLEDHTAVLMETLWDSERDAREFASAIRSWIGKGTASVRRTNQRVDVLFGSDPLALEDLARATG